MHLGITYIIQNVKATDAKQDSAEPAQIHRFYVVTENMEFQSKKAISESQNQSILSNYSSTQNQQIPLVHFMEKVHNQVSQDQFLDMSAMSNF